MSRLLRALGWFAVGLVMTVAMLGGYALSLAMRS